MGLRGGILLLIGLLILALILQGKSIRGCDSGIVVVLKGFSVVDFNLIVVVVLDHLVAAVGLASRSIARVHDLAQGLDSHIGRRRLVKARVGRWAIFGRDVTAVQVAVALNIAVVLLEGVVRHG